MEGIDTKVVPVVDETTEPEETTQNPFPESKAGSLISTAVLIIPIGAVLFFVIYCNAKGGEYDLDSFVEVTTAVRVRASPCACARVFA